MNVGPAKGGVYAKAQDRFDPKDVHQKPEPFALSVRRTHSHSWQGLLQRASSNVQAVPLGAWQSLSVSD